MRIDSPVMTNAQVTGSFSGSFTGVGNFVGLTADSVEYADVLNKPTLVSSSAQIDHDQTTNFSADEHFTQASITSVGTVTSGDVSAILPAGVVSSSAQITITESQISDLDHYTDDDVKTKLNSDAVVSGSAAQVRTFLNVEDGATGDQTAAEIRTLVESATDSNVFTDADHSKLDGIESGATGDMSDAEIKTAYENNSDTNAFTDALLSKLNGIEASADVTDTDNVTAAGALMDSEVDADLKTFSLPANTTISSFGASLVDDANAAAARTTLDVDQSGTDNSTDVTLVTTSHDYLSLSGQAITLGQIDISDDTNFAISDTTGQTGINLTLTGDTLTGVVSGLDTSDNVQFNNLTVSGDLTVSGTTTSINSTDLNVTDKLISINRGGSTAASADGGGLFISGANESITWDNGNSRFNFSDDVHAAGNITLTGTVDGRDVASDGTKLDGIESGATADQTAAEIRTLVESATDSNVFTDADHTKLNGIESAATADQSDAEIETAYNNQVAQVSSSERTAGTATAIKRFAPADIKSMIDTHQSDTVYTHPTHAGDDISIDTGALTGATVISDLDFNVTTDTSGHVTDANATVATRTLAAGDLGLGSSDNVTFNQITGSGESEFQGGVSVGMSKNSRAFGANYGNLMVKDTIGIYERDDTNTMCALISADDSNGLFIRGSAGSSFSTYGLKITSNTHTIEGSYGSNVIGNIIKTTGFTPKLEIGDSANYALGNKPTVTVYTSLNVKDDVVAYHSSDERFKDNIVEIDSSLEKIESLRGVYFDWNDKQDIYEGHDIGVIAQEVEEVLPEIVETREDGYKAVKYEKLTAVLIQAVKELAAKVKELENK